MSAQRTAEWVRPGGIVQQHDVDVMRRARLPSSGCLQGASSLGSFVQPSRHSHQTGVRPAAVNWLFDEGSDDIELDLIGDHGDAHADAVVAPLD
jgi:hypothetical protein